MLRNGQGVRTRSRLWVPALFVLLVVSPARVADADATSSLTGTLQRLDGELRRAAPDDAARRLAGHTYTEARRVLDEARELVRLGRIDDARAKVRLVELRVRLVVVAIDAARLEAMARDRERTSVRLREEGRVARAAFEQAYERRIEIENAPPVAAEPQGASNASNPAAPDGEE